jgi:hypothetical protein
MVNYNDPHTIAREANPYDLPSDLGLVAKLSGRSSQQRQLAGENHHHVQVFAGLFM